jgi:uncharacterized protein YjiS (DUF1127 family)
MAEMQQLHSPLLQRKPHLLQCSKNLPAREYVMSIANLFISAGRSIAEWRRRQRAYAELMALGDRSLADIGIHRSQIRALLEGDDIRGRDLEGFPSPEGSTFWPAQARLSGLSTRSNS